MSAIFIGAIILEENVLSFCKSADFRAVPVEAEAEMFRAIAELFDSAALQLDAKQDRPADEAE